MNNALKYLYHKFIDKSDKWYPFLSVFYLTNECDFRCKYCSDGHGKPYYQLNNKVLNANDAFQLIKNIRKHTDNLVITGGEPLQYPEFDKLFSKIKLLKFKNLVLTTNGFFVDKYIETIAGNFDRLIFSIDTLNPDKADAINGTSKGCFNKIMRNLLLARDFKSKKYEIVISSVATSENITDLYEVQKFAKRNNFEFAVAPQLVGVKACNDLNNSEEYLKLFDYLIREKKNGAKIFGSPLYLKYMQKLGKFNCHPFTMLVVSPMGDVYYPCLEIGHYAGNLLKENNLHQIRVNGEKKFGRKPQCGNQCHSACALGFGLIFSNLFSFIKS